MELIDEYLNQQTWRNWEKYFHLLPAKHTDQILDLGCSIGGFLNIAAAHCKKTVGVDLNPDFIAYCNTHKKANQEFICQDIQTLDRHLFASMNGVWCSYSLTYLKDPKAYLSDIFRALTPGSWIGVLDINCFISGNMPRHSPFYESVHTFELNSQYNGTYDFALGHKLPQYLSDVGFTIVHHDPNVSDPELNFNGPAKPDVWKNWEARLMRMPRLRQALGDAYPSMVQELLSFLNSKEHSQNQNVWFMIGMKPIS